MIACVVTCSELAHVDVSNGVLPAGLPESFPLIC
jgi:hypothetical protein